MEESFAALRQFEQALRERAEQLALVVRCTQVGSWSYDIGSGRLACSSECRRQLGWPEAAEATRERLLAAVHPADRDRFARALELALEEGGGFDLEYRVLLPDGTEHWLSTSAERHCADDGTPLRVFGVTVDVSAKMRSEAALRESEERFRQLAETVDEILWILDPQHQRWLYVSPAYRRLVGDPGRWPDPQGWLDAVHGEDRERVARLFAGAVSGGAFDLEHRLHTPRGVRWLHVHGLVSRDAQGRPTRLLGVSEDITARKLADLREATQAPGDGTVDAAEAARSAVANLRAFAARRRQSIVLTAAPEPMPVAGESRTLTEAVGRLVEAASRCAAEGARLDVSVQARNGLAVVEAGSRAGNLPRRQVERLLDVLVAPAADGLEGDALAAALAAAGARAEALGGRVGAESDRLGARGGFTLRVPLARPPPAPE